MTSEGGISITLPGVGGLSNVDEILGDLGREDGSNDGPTISQKQIEGSIDSISQLKLSGLDHVSQTRLRLEQNERDRLQIQDDSLRKLREDMSIVGKEADVMNAAIDMRWGKLRRKDDPVNLQSLLENQIESCQNIISKSEGLIANFKKFLKSKDREYIDELKKQEDSVDRLCRKMNKQLSLLVTRQGEELEKIENAYERERQDMMKTYDDDLEGASHKRRELERLYLKLRMNRASKNEKKLEDSINNERENFSQLKKERDERVQELERNIDVLHAKNKLNGEKLDHFRKVLKRKTVNSKAQLKQVKDKLNELSEVKTNIKQLYRRDDWKHRQKNNRRTTQYNRLAKQYKDLLKKFRYFEQADVQKYKKIWKMNEETAKEKVDKLLRMDKFVDENILGKRYIPPSNEEFIGGGEDDGSGGTDRPSSQHGEGTRDDQLNVVGGEGMTQTKARREEILSAKELTAAKIILSQLCDQTEFLIEEKILLSLQKLQSGEEKTLLKLSSILEVLGLSQAEDVDHLIQFFIENHSEEFDHRVSQGNKGGQGQGGEFKIPPEHVLNTLRNFLDEHKRRKKEEEEEKRKKRKLYNKDRSGNEKKRVNQQRKKTEEREFWERIENVLPDTKIRLWGVLEHVLDRYEKLLKERMRITKENRMLGDRNGEMRRLIHGYRNSKVTEELIIPPPIFD